MPPFHLLLSSSNYKVNHVGTRGVGQFVYKVSLKTNNGVLLWIWSTILDGLDPIYLSCPIYVGHP